MFRILLGAAVMLVIVAVSWKLLMRPPGRPKAAPLPSERIGPGYLTVTGAAVDIEVRSPTGARATTVTHTDTGTRIAGAEARVDCGGYGQEKEADETCTSSVSIPTPAFGDYTIVVTSNAARAETITVGWGGTTFQRAGGFGVLVEVEPRRATQFAVIVAPEGVSQRTQPAASRP